MNREGFLPEGIVHLEHSQGYRNKIEKMRNGTDIFYRKTYKERTSMNNEAQTIRLIAENADHRSYSIPHILSVDNDAMSIIFSEVKGDKLENTKPTETALVILGHALSEFHRLPTSGLTQLRNNHDETITLYQYRIAKSHALSDEKKDVSHRAANLLLENECFNSGVGIIHGDCNASNIIYDEKEKKIGFIDFERSGIGMPELDLARVLWRVCDHDPVREETFLHAYYQEKSTPKDSDRLRVALINEYFGAVAYYAWEGWQNNYPFYQDAIERLEQMV